MKVKSGNAEKASDIQGKPQAVPGKYHVTWSHVNDSRVKKDGSPLNATIFEGEVLGGTVPGQEGKTLTLYARLGKNGEETDEYCGVVSRLALSCGLLTGKNQEKEISGEDFENQQCIVEWESYMGKDNKEHFSVAQFGLATWGVNDAEVADVPRNTDAIRLWREATGQAGSNGNGHAAATVDAGAGVNTDDI